MSVGHKDKDTIEYTSSKIKARGLFWWLNGKNLPAIAGDTRDSVSVLGLGRSPGEGNGNPLQYSCLENPMERGPWQATVHGVARVGHNLVTKPSPPPRSVPALP